MDNETSELLRRGRLEFVYELVPAYGVVGLQEHTASVEQRIFDGDHRWVGQVREEEPARKPTLENRGLAGERIHAAVYDKSDARVVAFERRRESPGHLDVADGTGRPVGSIEVGSADDGGTGIYDCSRERVGGISGKGGRRVALEFEFSVRYSLLRFALGALARDGSFDFTVENAYGNELGWIADPIACAKRKGITVRRGLRSRLTEGETPDRHFLTFVRDVTPDLRLLMVAASAGVHLVLSAWATPPPND